VRAPVLDPTSEGLRVQFPWATHLNGAMNKSNKFSAEVRERAVRLVREHRGEYPSQWAAIESIAPKIVSGRQTRQTRLDELNWPTATVGCQR